MKRLTGKHFLILFLLALLALPSTVLADSGNEFTKMIAGYQVTVIFEKPASLGENQVQIRVMDAQKLPVSTADLEMSILTVQEQQSEAAPIATNPAAKMENLPTTPTIKPTSDNSMAGMDGVKATPTSASSMAGMEGPSATPTAASSMGGMNDTSEKSAQKPEMAKTDPMHDQMVKLAAGHQSGEYEGQVSIESAGDLILRIHLTVEGKLMEVDFPLHVEKSHTGTFVLGGFFALNAAIISGAVLLKPKPVL